MSWTITAEWVPHLRMQWVEPNGRDFGDNPGFREWLITRSHREQLRIYSRPGGTLNSRECYRLWRYLGRTDPIPKALTIRLNKQDFDKFVAELPNMMSRKISDKD